MYRAAIGRLLWASLVVASTFLVNPAGVEAQATRSGSTYAVGAVSAVRYNDIAYDASQDIYLAVSGQGRIMGRFLNGAGTPLGPGEFSIQQTGAYTMVSRAAWSQHLGGFLVTWLDTRENANLAQIWGRLVKYVNGAPVFVSADFKIAGAPGGARSETAAAIAYSTGSQEFLVAWQHYESGLNDVRGQRVGLAGQLIGGEIPISYDRHWQNEPAIDYDPQSNLFLVGWQNYTEPSGPAAIHVRSVQAGTGALGTVHVLWQSSTTGSSWPDVAYQPGSQRHLVTWHSSSAQYGRFVGADGAPITAAAPLALRTCSYDAGAVAHNPKAGSFFKVYHGCSHEDAGVEVSASGVPGVPFDVTATGNTGGNFYPRVVSHGQRGEWLLVEATQATKTAQQLVGQLITTSGLLVAPPPPPPPPPTPPPTGQYPKTTPNTPLSRGDAPNGSWYFAEGVAGNGFGFDTYYLLTNEHDTAVTFRAFFCRDSGACTKYEDQIPMRSRKTLSLRDIVGTGNYSAVFQTMSQGYQIYVARSVYWGPDLEGSSVERGVKEPSRTWYFAEGSRRGEYFDNFYLLFNPNPTPLSVMATYYVSGGESFMLPYGINANQRLTIDASRDPRLANRDFSVTFDTMSDALPIVAERAMYWSKGTWAGGHASMGAKALGTQWHFAEGLAVPRFETYYTVLNPQASWTTLSARYFVQGQPNPVTRTYNLPPLSRYTIILKNTADTNQYTGGGTGEAGNVAASFTSSLPTLVERSVYWGGAWPNWIEGSNVVGVSAAKTEWRIPEGSLGPGFDSFVLVSNPGDTAVRVTLRVWLDGTGGRLSKFVDVPARSRVSLNMRNGTLDAGDQAALMHRSFSVSISSPAPIIVEHALYRSLVPGTFWWRAGGASFGVDEQ